MDILANTFLGNKKRFVWGGGKEGADLQGISCALFIFSCAIVQFELFKSE